MKITWRQATTTVIVLMVGAVGLMFVRQFAFAALLAVGAVALAIWREGLDDAPPRAGEASDDDEDEDDEDDEDEVSTL